MTGPTASSAPWVRRLAAVIFVLALGFHAWGVSVGWKNINLPGYEFRQTQTAISAYFIQREANFSLAYPTPVLGKPWSVPFEFPLYQWTAVTASNRLHVPLVEAGRGVSAVCFYLALVAFGLLLRRLGLTWPQQAVALSLVLTCPLYIFYSRAFLIETMALMFSLWYLCALVEGMERRQSRWLVLAALAGIGASLVKVTTFIVWLIPAALWCGWWLWSARAPGQAGPPGRLRRTFATLAAVHVLPFASAWWWVHFSDRVKSLNPSGAGLTSTQLTDFNFGTGRRLDPAIWSSWWHHITGNVAGPVTLVAGAALLLVFGGRWRRLAAISLGIFLTVLLVFPVLYSFHGYYFVANALLLLGAIALGAAGLMESRRPRWLALAAVAGLCAGQGWHYLADFYPMQHVRGNGGGLAEALQAMTDPEDSIIIAGEDWSSILPYYAQRRALMLRSELPDRPEYLKQAFALMKDANVAALVLLGPQRQNRMLLSLARQYFDLEVHPLLSWQHLEQGAVVYVHRQLAPHARKLLGERQFYEVTPLASPVAVEDPLKGNETEYAALLPAYQKLFRLFEPRPVRFYSTFGPEIWLADHSSGARFAAHPETRLWFGLPPGRHRIRTDLALSPGAWQGVPAADASDGVELIASAAFKDGRREILQRRYLNPLANPADRNGLAVDWTVDLPAGAELLLEVTAGPAGNGARDWSSLGPVRIE